MRLILLLLLAVVGLVVADEKPCTVHADGKYYDLSNLMNRKDFELKTPGGYKLAINVCQSVTTEIVGLKDDLKVEDVGAFVRKAHGDFSLGKLNTTLSVVDSKPRMVLSNGSRCKAKDGTQLEMRGSTIVEFICDKSLSISTGQPRLLGQLPPGDDEVPCAYFFEWKTHFACPTSEDGSWGFFAIMAVLVLVLLLTYTVLGTLYNRFVLQLRGFDQIPQFSVESMKYHASEAMDWIRDIAATYNIGGGGGLPYTSSRRQPTNPVSHHTQANEELNINQGSTFVRPQASSQRPQTATNPVSHFTQAQSESSPVTSPPPPPPKQSLSQFVPSRVNLGARGPTKEEQEFMLGDEDDDEEGEELQNKPVSSSPAPPSQFTEPQTTTTVTSSTLNRGNVDASAIRGRNSSDGPIRL